MPLTNVWTRDASDEWVRTDAEETDRHYRYSVSADSKLFRCYSCFQYVTFVKGSEYRVSHFRHSSSEANKDCEDRSLINVSSASPSANMSDSLDPMRLVLEGKRVSLEVGFYPISSVELQKAIDGNLMISIQDGIGKPDVYKVDHSRFAPHTMCWLHLPLSWALNYSVAIKPSEIAPKLWSISRTPLSKFGDLFDCRTGYRIPEKSDVMVGEKYYFLCSRWVCLPARRSIQLRQIEIRDDGWRLYQICAPSYSDEAADFFFDLHLRLTTMPADISVIWPPVVEGEDIIETNQKEITFLVRGESDFEAYPAHTSFVTENLEISEHERVISIKNFGALQLVSASRYNQKLRRLYIRPLDAVVKAVQPELQVLDEDRKMITDNELSRPPKNGNIIIKSEVDAFVDVSDQDGFCYRKDLTSGVESRIMDVKNGMILSIRQGLDTVRTIVIASKKSQRRKLDQPEIWTGKLIPFPRRYAGILYKMDHTSPLYIKVLGALQSGFIPEDGMKWLMKLLGDEHRE